MVGIELGFIEGRSLAAPLGEWLALADGLLLVASLGLDDNTFEGAVEGRVESTITGLEDGKFEGEVEGALLPVTDGLEDASAVGGSDLDADGGWLAANDGEVEGALLPVTDGLEDASAVGKLVG